MLHHQVVRSNVVKLANVRMVEGGYGAGFALETLGELGFGNFDGYCAVQTGIARFIYLAHTPGADLREDFIGPELIAGR